MVAARPKTSAGQPLAQHSLDFCLAPRTLTALIALRAAEHTGRSRYVRSGLCVIDCLVGPGPLTSERRISEDLNKGNLQLRV